MKSANRNSLLTVLSTVVLAVGCGSGPNGSVPNPLAATEDVYQSTEELSPGLQAVFCAEPCKLPVSARELSERLRKRAGCVEVCDGIDNNCNGTVDEGVKNACDGCAALPAAPGTPCQSGDQCGIYECDGKDAVKCGSLRSCGGPDRPEWDAGACLTWADALVQQGSTMYFGSYTELPGSTDPTGGYLLGNIPEVNDEWHTQLFASYVACDGSNVNVQGYAQGRRAGNELQNGEWFLDLIEGDFWGSFLGSVNGNEASGSYDTLNASPRGERIPDYCNAPNGADGQGWGVPNADGNGACYCASPGTWQGTKVSSMAATFDVSACPSGNGIRMTATANPQPIVYTIFSASQACRKANPLVAFCMEEMSNRGVEDACWANVANRCKISKISDIDPTNQDDLRSIRECECFYIGDTNPFVPGDVYLVVGATKTGDTPTSLTELAEMVLSYLKNPGTPPPGLTAYPRLYKHP